MTQNTLHSKKALNDQAHRLAQICPHMSRALDQVAPLTSRQRPDGFSAMVQIIVGQQISVRAAQAIWARLEQAQLTSKSAIIKCDDQSLRDCGLSASKMRYVRALAHSSVDSDALRDMPDDLVRQQLLPITGIGPWSVDIYLMFCLGRADIMPLGDLALQVAAQILYGLDKRPTPKELSDMSQSWRPYRSAAAHILWAYYAIEKSKEGIL